MVRGLDPFAFFAKLRPRRLDASGVDLLLPLDGVGVRPSDLERFLALDGVGVRLCDLERFLAFDGVGVRPSDVERSLALDGVGVLFFEGVFDLDGVGVLFSKGALALDLLGVGVLASRGRFLQPDLASGLAFSFPYSLSRIALSRAGVSGLGLLTFCFELSPGGLTRMVVGLGWPGGISGELYPNGF